MQSIYLAALLLAPIQDPVTDPVAAYRKVVAKTAAMVANPVAQKLAKQHGLRILNVTWEDTGRFKDSAVGPNISDMTIQVQQTDPETKLRYLTCMPVIRHPNFGDKTGDVPIERFYLLTGNESGQGLRRVSLKAMLGDLRSNLSKPMSWKGSRKSLLAERDKYVLVSAQACFLPIPRGKAAEFNPVLFNYQSYEGDPAVLTILATPQGTSVTIIDNKRDAFEAGQTWGQRLFFNKNGKRAVLTGRRLSDHLAEKSKKGGAASKTPRVSPTTRDASLSMVMLIQVPLKQKNPRPVLVEEQESAKVWADDTAVDPKSNVESAVIGHGRVEGPFTEIADLDIERDTRFPIRVTVQFYKATNNGVVSAGDMESIAAQIGRVYADADYVGSLVTEGETGRPTEHDGEKVEPPHWWDEFWARHEFNTGQTQQDAMRMLRRLFGPNWRAKPRAELAKALAKKK